MKIVYQLSLSLAIVFLISSCVQAPDAETAKIEAPKTETKTTRTTGSVVDLNKSKLVFTGTKPTGRHTGEFPLKAGDLQFKDGKPVSGKFTFDLTQLKITDLTGDMASKLSDHLKSADFFEVEKHPEANFVVTHVKSISDPDNQYKVIGNLTLKGISKSISFKATATNNKTYKANFNIDRTNWDLTYGNDKSLGDKFINPLVNIDLTIVLK